MDAEENQRQVFLRAHSPWKSQTTRFPHSHSRCSAWKSGKPKAGFPLSHLLSLLFNQIKKGNPAADRFAPASRLILQLENAEPASSSLCEQGFIHRERMDAPLSRTLSAEFREVSKRTASGARAHAAAPIPDSQTH